MLNWHTHLKKFITFPRSHHPPFHFKFSSTVSDPHSFTVSYLVTHCGFSPETALATCRNLRFDSPEKPDSVLAFFATQGFSLSQIRDIIKHEHRILLCDPKKVLLPKFHFLRSKGASTSDIIRMVTTGPGFLSRSLDNHIVPAYQFIRTFLPSDKLIIQCLNRNSCFISDARFLPNAHILLHNGVTHSSIARLLHMWPSILCSCNLSDTVQELKQLGFDASTTTFTIALLAKRTVNKTMWAEKVKAYKKWGWSEDDVLAAFKRHPYCMMTSPDTINAVFSFWVKKLGGSSLELVKYPVLFQKRIAPRASVLRFLALQGLRKARASIVTPFLMTDKSFLDKFVKPYQKHSAQLLNMYQENMNVANSKEKKNTCL